MWGEGESKASKAGLSAGGKVPAATTGAGRGNALRRDVSVPREMCAEQSVEIQIKT